MTQLLQIQKNSLLLQRNGSTGLYIVLGAVWYILTVPLSSAWSLHLDTRLPRELQ